MIIVLTNREEAYKVGAWLVDSFDQSNVSVRNAWLVEHTEDDGHGDITAYSLTLNKGITKEDGTKSTGNVVVGGTVTGSSSGTFAGNVTALSTAPNSTGPVNIGDMINYNGLVNGAGLHMKFSTSEWIIAANLGLFSAIPDLAFLDVTYQPSTSGMVFAIRRTSVPPALPATYVLGPLDSTISLALGSATSGDRWGQVVSQDVLFGGLSESELDTNGHVLVGNGVGGNYRRVVIYPASGSELAYFQRLTNHQMGFGMNLLYTGSFNLDDTARSGWLARLIDDAEGDLFSIERAAAGTNPRTPVAKMQVNANGAVLAGGAFAPGGAGFAMPNLTGLYGTNNAGNAALRLISISTGDETLIDCNSSYLSFANPATATTIGAAGGAAALPANPVGYLRVKIAGTGYKIPYYNE